MQSFSGTMKVPCSDLLLQNIMLSYKYASVVPRSASGKGISGKLIILVEIEHFELCLQKPKLKIVEIFSLFLIPMYLVL